MRFLAIVIIVMLFTTIACKREKETSLELPAKQQVIEKEIEVEPPIKERFTYPDWVEIEEDLFTKLDIRYATANNFVDEILYPCGKCFLREEAFQGLEEVRTALKNQGIGIILYDCYRPKPVQQHLWNKVPNPSYVTPPKKGSMHNRGVALDIGLIDSSGQILDMGTEFDYFGREGHHDYYEHPQEVLENRKLLKETMEQFGFASIRTEWWHYSYVKGTYALAEWMWECD